MAKENCKICNNEYKSIMSLARHITQTHKITTQQYFDKYLGGSLGCKICGGTTSFYNLKQGYQSYCNHKCGAKGFRAIQKADPAKELQFVIKIAKAQTKVWANRSKEEKQAIADKGTNKPGKRFFSKTLKDVSQLSRELELIGRKNCHALGIKPNYYDSWNQSSILVEHNILVTLGII